MYSFCLFQVLIHRNIYWNIENASKSMLHLSNRIVLQDDDELLLLFSLLQALRLATIVVFQGDDCVSVTLIVCDDNRYTQLTRRLGETVATHSKWIDT